MKKKDLHTNLFIPYSLIREKYLKLVQEKFVFGTNFFILGVKIILRNMAHEWD